MKDGLKPAIPKCFYCHQDKNELLLDKRLYDSYQGRMEKLHGRIVDMIPCDKCHQHMEEGIILITIDNEKSDKDWNIPPGNARTSIFVDKPSEAHNSQFWVPNPYRTGGWFVVREESLETILDEDSMNHARSHRFMFMEEAAARQLGLYDIMPSQGEEHDGPGSNS